MKPKQDDELMGHLTRNDIPGHEGFVQPITAEFWQFLRRKAPEDATERAERVGLYISWLHTAEEAAKGSDPVALKEIADKARNYAGDIPSKIPKDGFRDLDNFEYPEPLNLEEIRAVLMADMERRNLLELYAAGERIRKAGVQ